MIEWQAIEPLDILRMLCGIWFLPHCIGKIRHATLASGTFEKAGFKPPLLFVYLTISMELLSGAGLVLNIYPRVSAAMAVAVLLGAAYAVVKINGFNWRWQKQGPEYMLFWAAACIVSVAG